MRRKKFVSIVVLDILFLLFIGILILATQPKPKTFYVEIRGNYFCSEDTCYEVTKVSDAQYCFTDKNDQVCVSRREPIQ